MHISKRFLSVVVPSFLAGVILGGIGVGLAATVRGSAIFSDVAEGSFYDEAVGEMYSAGIIKGYSNGQFGPNDFVTRGQIAVLMKRLRDDVRGSVSSSSSAQSTSSSVSSSSSSSSSSVANVHGSFQFANANFNIPETVPQITLSVQRSGGSSGAATVTYSVKAGTAVDGTNFTSVNDSVLQFATGETSKTFTVYIKNSAAAAGPVTVLLELKNPTGDASLGAQSTATLTILDKDSSNNSSSTGQSSSSPPAGTIGFSATAYEVNETVGTAVFTVNRTGGTTGQVGVSYTTVDKTASAGAKYSATTGTLSFAAGETTKTIAVPIIDNPSVDGKKTFGLTLSAPTGGAALGSPPSVTVSIADNESGTFGSGSFLFAKGNYIASKAEGKIEVTVNRVGGTTTTGYVTYTTVNGSAIAGRDYTSLTATLTFLSGESSKVIAIPLLKDVSPSNGNYFTVTLSNPTGGTSLDTPSTAQVNVYE